jgi:hypothetical protein
MQVNYQDKSIIKPQGKRTPASVIQFDELNRFIKIFKEVVDVNSPADAVALWVEAGYPQDQAIEILYSVIVRFGGGHRIWGRFHKVYSSTVDEVNSFLREAHIRRHEDVDSLRAVLKNIKGLGSLSYSTKMLRFLNPNHVVLDSILQEEFCLSIVDYKIFATHCRRIAEILEVDPVDIESGLYAYVQIANPAQRQKVWKQYQNELLSLSNSGKG